MKARILAVAIIGHDGKRVRGPALSAKPLYPCYMS